MALSDLSQAGSVAEVSQRLLLWARRDGGGLARVEYSSEFARQQVMQWLQASLAQDGIALTMIALPLYQSATEVVQALLQQLAQVPNGVVSVTGFATAFNAQTPLADALRVVNFNREALTAFPLRQLWWMTPALLQTSLHAMPDLHGWFTPQLNLSEVVFANPVANTEPMLNATEGSRVNIDDAHQRSQGLLNQFAAARSAGAADMDLLTTYLLPALESLAEVGAQKELRDLTSSFEGLLGLLKLINVPEMATSLSRLANLYSAQGRYGEAELLYVRSLQICEQQLGVDHLDTATSFNNLAGLYESQGRYSEAEPLHLKALEIRQTQLGHDHPDTAASLNNLAELYRLQGRYSEAEPLHLKALEIWQTQLGHDHLNTAASLNNLALLYEFQGRYSEAEPLYLQALEIRRSQLGHDHPDTAASLNNLASLYESQERYSEAEPLYLQALEIRRSQLGHDHPDTASSLNNLAGLYRLQGRYSEAESLYLQVLEIARSQLGHDHPHTAFSLNNLAGLYNSQGRYSEAELLYLQALAILFSRLGENHPNIITGLNNFRTCLQQASEAGQGDRLSDHPLTQLILQQLRTP